MSSIYQLTKDYEDILGQIQDNFGEITPEIEEQLAINEQDFTEKAESYCKFIRNNDSDINGIDEEIKRLNSRKKALKTLNERLKENLSAGMAATERDKFAAGTFKLSFRSTTRCEVMEDAIDELPDEFKKVEISPKKAEIAKFLKDGGQLSGCTLISSKSLQIR